MPMKTESRVCRSRSEADLVATRDHHATAQVTLDWGPYTHGPDHVLGPVASIDYLDSDNRNVCTYIPSLRVLHEFYPGRVYGLSSRPAPIYNQTEETGEI